jgi:chromosome segregation ATPase
MQFGEMESFMGWTDNEEELRRQLERCGTDLSKSKRQQQILEKQLEKENTMRNCLNQQLEDKEEQLTSFQQCQKRAETAEAIAKRIQDELKDHITENDKLVHKNGLTEKELAKIKKSAKGKINADKEMLDSLKRERSSFLRKMETKKEKNRQANLDIEEERRTYAQYMVQLEEERSIRKAAKADMRDYQKKGRVFKRTDNDSTI